MPIKRKPNKLKVVVDTSVVIAGITALKTPPIVPYNDSQRVLNSCSRQHCWVFSEDILDEYKRVMKKLGIHPTSAGKLINYLRDFGQLIVPREEVTISPDPADDMFYSCALTCEADIIVTLNLKDFPQIGKRPKILSPKQFAALFP